MLDYDEHEDEYLEMLDCILEDFENELAELVQTTLHNCPHQIRAALLDNLQEMKIAMG